MPLYTEFTSIPLTPLGKLAYPYTTEDTHLTTPRFTNPAQFWYSARIYHDDTALTGGVVVKRPCLIYFHGSAPLTWPSDGNVELAAMRGQGFNVLLARGQDAGSSSKEVDVDYDNGYGSSLTGNPFGSFFTGAYHIQSMIEFADTQKAAFFTDVPYVLVGFSLGSNRICTWSYLSNVINTRSAARGVPTDYKAKVSVMWATALAIGGSGSKIIANANLMLNSLTQIASNVKHPTLLSWGSGDTFCPPDMHRRVQAGSKMNGNTLAEFTFPGGQGHASSAIANQAWIDDFSAFLTTHGAKP